MFRRPSHHLQSPAACNRQHHQHQHHQQHPAVCHLSKYYVLTSLIRQHHRQCQEAEVTSTLALPGQNVCLGTRSLYLTRTRPCENGSIFARPEKRFQPLPIMLPPTLDCKTNLAFGISKAAQEGLPKNMPPCNTSLRPTPSLPQTSCPAEEHGSPKHMVLRARLSAHPRAANFFAKQPSKKVPEAAPHRQSATSNRWHVGRTWLATQ